MVLDIIAFNPLILKDKAEGSSRRLSALLSDLVIKFKQNGKRLLWPIFEADDLNDTECRGVFPRNENFGLGMILFSRRVKLFNSYS